jgi:hypothetical protein
MTTKPSDFVNVQLSAAGAKLGAVRVATGRWAYAFEPGKSQRVLTSEWSRVLSQEKRGGESLFEIAPAAASMVQKTAVPVAPADPAPTPETAVSAEQKGK